MHVKLYKPVKLYKRIETHGYFSGLQLRKNIGM